ncbi:MAG: alpha/beta fold hydrolase [Candidatus Eisenbacteria bacterium]
MAGTHVNTFHDGKEVTGYFVPAVQGRGPGLLVLQEWWGLVPHVEDLCNRFAAEGFTCLAPDLYHGKTTKSPDEAGKLMMALNIEGALRDLMAAAAYLEAQSATTGERVGVVGFCMGGQLALYAACNAPEVGAAVDSTASTRTCRSTSRAPARPSSAFRRPGRDGDARGGGRARGEDQGGGSLSRVSPLSERGARVL